MTQKVTPLSLAHFCAEYSVNYDIYAPLNKPLTG
jgi:hypothetical protein